MILIKLFGAALLFGAGLIFDKKNQGLVFLSLMLAISGIGIVLSKNLHRIESHAKLEPAIFIKCQDTTYIYEK